VTRFSPEFVHFKMAAIAAALFRNCVLRQEEVEFAAFDGNIVFCIDLDRAMTARNPGW